MGKIFKNQSALRIEADCNVDITGALAIKIKYKKPDDSTGEWTATIDDAENGIIYYDVLLTTELDQSGTWIMWSYIQFSDGRIAEGLPIRVKVHDSGTFI